MTVLHSAEQTPFKGKSDALEPSTSTLEIPRTVRNELVPNDLDRLANFDSNVLHQFELERAVLDGWITKTVGNHLVDSIVTSESDDPFDVDVRRVLSDVVRPELAFQMNTHTQMNDYILTTTIPRQQKLRMLAELDGRKVASADFATNITNSEITAKKHTAVAQYIEDTLLHARESVLLSKTERYIFDAKIVALKNVHEIYTSRASALDLRIASGEYFSSEEYSQLRVRLGAVAAEIKALEDVTFEEYQEAQIDTQASQLAGLDEHEVSNNTQKAFALPRELGAAGIRSIRRILAA